MASNQLRLNPSPIQFGTDGWRGVLGVDVTLERLLSVAAAASQELLFRSSPDNKSREVLIGFDRRFLAEELAEAVASAVQGCGLEPVLTETAVPTPACSWAVVKRRALGALVVTASHNPPEWIGLKIKGPFGGSVERDFTKSVERRIALGVKTIPQRIDFGRIDFRKIHIQDLKKKFDINSLVNGLKEIGLKVIVDSMHGSAAGCISELLEVEDEELVEEIRSSRDPLFGGNSPEPLLKNVSQLVESVKSYKALGKNAVGLIFDGDGDRIAAIDENGRFCSTQLLMPLLIDHLVRVRKLPGRIVKTVSGCDLMKTLAEHLGREVVELPVGFKYIASEMLASQVVIGGEESGGVGFGMHLPERDALFAALLLLESIKDSKLFLGDRLKELENSFGSSFYDRVDIKLSSMEEKFRLENLLKESPPTKITNINVKEIITIDGMKLRLGKNFWLMFRFSGTEPLLRIYCEAPTKKDADLTLNWAKDFCGYQ